MIETWQYDDGKPYYRAALDKWSEQRRPCWRFVISSWKHDVEPVLYWCNEQFTESEYEAIHRFNDGMTFWCFEFYENEKAMNFLMRWS
jgi:hypothetical protein